MIWLKSKKLNIFLIYLNIMFILGVFRRSYEILYFNYLFVTFLYIISVFIYWFYNIVLHNVRQRLIFIICIMAAFGIYIYFFNKGFIVNFFVEGIIKNVENINKNLYDGKVTYFTQYLNIFILSITIASILFLYFDSKGLITIVLIFNLIILIFLWYLGYTEAIINSLFRFTFISIITYAVSINNRLNKNFNKYNVKLSIKNNKIIYQVIVCSLLMSLFIWILPKDFEGKYGKLLTDKFNNSFSSNSNVKTSKLKQYKLEQSGYSDSEKNLGGRIVLNDQLALRVNSDKPYHLKGNVKDVYTGHSWLHYNKDFKPGDGNKEVINGIKDYTYDIGEPKRIFIFPQNLKAYSIFTPDIPVKIYLEEGEIYKNEASGIFINSKPVSRGYSVEYYENDWIESRMYNIEDLYNKKIFSKDFEKRYEQIPNSVTDRTRVLVNEITRGSKNDVEKVRKIQDYLKNNYKYSLDVSEVPEDKDFVDYFLFEEKKGYCVYFATATTIMCRIAGIPARYVEGFKMPQKSKEDGFYAVTNQDAHAWTEVCFDERGLIWTIVDTSATPSEQEEIQRNAQRNNNITSQDNENIDPRKDRQKQKPIDENEKGSNNNKRIDMSKVIFIIVVSLLLIYVAIRITINNFIKRKVIKTEGVIALYLYVQNRLKAIGMVKSDIETDMDFVSRIYDEDLRKNMISLVDAVYREFYGGEIDQVFNKKSFYGFIEKHIKSYSPIKYYLKRYLIF